MGDLEVMQDEIPQSKVIPALQISKAIGSSIYNSPSSLMNKKDELKNMTITNPDNEETLVTLKFDKAPPTQNEIGKLDKNGNRVSISEDEYSKLTDLISQKFNQKLDENESEISANENDSDEILSEKYDAVNKLWNEARSEAMYELDLVPKHDTSNPFDEAK